MKEILLIALLLIASNCFALSAKPQLPEDAIGLIPVKDAYFNSYLAKCLAAGDYETKVVKASDPADPIYEVDYSKPISRLISTILKNTIVASR